MFYIFKYFPRFIHTHRGRWNQSFIRHRTNKQFLCLIHFEDLKDIQPLNLALANRRKRKRKARGGQLGLRNILLILDFIKTKF
jgi:hypothetical protein